MTFACPGRAIWGAAVIALVLAVAPRRIGAQPWNDARTRELVARATQRRAAMFADSGLADYRASARGYVTFLAQLGDGLFLPPKVIKADELALEVYWRAPTHSRQWIVGRRDTLLLPTDIQYHRDHLGIVQNNFPDIIRLGDGDEVQDVAHPLSPSGLVTYDFAISDSLRVEIPGKTIDVYEVKVRPRDQTLAAAVGALYLSRDDAQVVRMAFSFTRAALKDDQLDDVSVILENSLIEQRFWLPRRQEIEIRRSGSWMDFPARGIIRGRWDIRDYVVNTGDSVTARAPGPEIVLAPAARRARHTWPSASILEQLPEDVRLATGDDVRQVQEEARTLVRQQMLDRRRGVLPAARGFSDVVSVNRAEGLAVGAGLRSRFGRGWSTAARLRYGVADQELKGSFALTWERGDALTTSLSVIREYRAAGDVPEMSRVASSLAAQEFGSDYSDPFDARGVDVSVGIPTRNGSHWRLYAGHESARPVANVAYPAFGRFEPALDVARTREVYVGLSVRRPRVANPGGTEWEAQADVRSVRVTGDLSSRFARGFGVAKIHPRWQRELEVRLAYGAVAGPGPVPVQHRFLVGGPVSLPGYAFHQFADEGFLSAAVSREFEAPFFAVPLGRWGRVPGSVTLSPSAGVAFLSRPRFPKLGGEVAPRGWYPFVGISVLPFFELVRIDLARGLRDGRWRITADVSRDFWPIL
jgi:hypothetical protein